jgi:uncharacterized protein YfaS (alpha-2-macroglobulin family)
MFSHRHSKTWIAFTLVVIASLACNWFAPAPTATPVFTPTPAASPTPLPPIAPNVIDHLPVRGDELPTDGAITVYFDSPMNRSTVEAAFSISPQVKGAFEWPDDSTLVFKPGAPLERAARYVVTIGAEAQSQAGLTLAEEVAFKADTVGFLEVTQVLPADGTFGADVTSVITVMFNRPVVPLSSLADQAGLPNPLTLEPAVEGQGEWLNTSIFVFRPGQPLLGGQRYTGAIKAGLQDTTGGLLKEDFVWAFDTAVPEIVSTDPGVSGARGITLTQPISVTFNQLMDRPSTEAAFTVTGPDGSVVPGSYQWSADGLTVGFVPSANYALGTTYTARMNDTALSMSGGARLSQPRSILFETVQFPAIVSTDPSDGARDVPTYTGFRIYFASPMDASTLDSNIQIIPEPTQVYTYWNDYDFSYYIGWDLKPSTDYEVTLGAGMADPYGNVIPAERTVRFTTAPLPPQAYFNIGGLVGTFNAYAASTEIYVSTVGVNTLRFSLHRLSLKQLAAFTGPDTYFAFQNYQPQPADLVREWSTPVENAPNQLVLTRVPLAEGGGALDPGAYYLTMSSPELPDYSPQTQLLVVSGANLTLKTSFTNALVWATDLNTGQPLANLPVAIYSDNFTRLAEGQTDAEGVFTADIGPLDDLWTGMIAASEGGTSPSGGGPGKASFAVTRSDWSLGLDAWDFGVNGQYYQQDLVAYLYTDRPIYRPGQVVYFKGVLRNENDARFSLPDVSDVRAEIYNDQGEMVYSDTLKLTPFGTFAGEFKLADEAGLGYYSLSVYSGDRYIGFGGLSFTVAEYRKPEFQVAVTAPVTQTVQGATIPVTVEATFFFGGPVSNADVHWSVLSADYVFQYAGEGYYDFYNFDYSSGFFGPQYGTYGRVIAEKDGKTDAQGRAAFEVKADLSDTGVSQVYTIEANVTDTAGGQQVAGRTQVIVHQGQFYVGVRPEVYVAEAGKPVSVEIITVDWESNAFPNQNLHVVYNDHQWNCALEKDPNTGSDTWTCHVKDTEVASADVTTDAKGMASSSFTPEKGGVYQVKVTGTDAGGRTVTASTYLWVSEPGGYVLWRQNNNDRIDLVTDRKSYRPGDTAEILIPSPFQGSATALITIERGRILEHKVVTLTDNSTVYKLPITSDYAPDVFFSVVIMKGVDETNPAPEFKMGLAKIAVSTEQQALSVTLTPDKTKVGPRDTVTYAIRATDYTGKPVQAEFSVGVVDLAVLSLTTPNSGPILDAFYGERGLGVRTGTGLTLSVDRLNIAAARDKGGGGGAEAGFAEVRTNFLDTAYWNATVTTDANGEASVSVTLPDNLTTWRLDARGLTADTRVGQGTTDIVATKDLLIRPQTPRFFVVGDQAQLAAVVNNNTAQDIQATVMLAGTGVDLASSPAQNVTVKANDRVEVTWGVTVQDIAFVDVTFSVEGGGLRDASKPTLGIPPNQLLPVYKYSAPETVATAGQLESADSVLEAISLPRRFDVTQGELTVELDPSLAAAMTGGLDYLEHYPYECTEQTVSRFLPNVLTYKALKDLGLADPALEEKLNSLVRVGLQRLYARQHYDGGWGWWANDQSDPYVSAYVVFGLVKAKEAGFAVNEGVLSSGIVFLQNYASFPVGGSDQTHGLNSLAPIPESDWMLNRTVFILYVLAEAGEPNISASVQAFENRSRLDIYARAYLALTLHLIDPDDSRLKTLLSDINNKAILSATGAHWEEAATDWWNMNTDTRSTAIVLDTLVRLDPNNNLIPNAVRWLMVAREAQAWETTQETAWALIGLTDWMVVSGELKANYQYNVTLNGEPLTSGEANASNLRDSVTLRVAVADLLRDQANRLVINRGGGDGRLYYTAHLNVYFPVEDVRAVSRGITVARQYTIRSGNCGGPKQPACPPVTEAKAGQDIQVKVTLIAPHDLYYVVLEDPLPAGMEPVDTSLLTTSQVGQPPQLNSADPLYYGWGWWWFSNTDLRDEKVVLFATWLPKGTYEYTYTLHASRPGVYKVIPTNAYEFYFPEVFGRGDGMVFTINP